MDFSSNLKPNNSSQRRFSTGNSIIEISDQKPIPNYLKSSTGSCHDLCKYGTKRDFPAESISPTQYRNKSALKFEERSKTNKYGGKKTSETKNIAVPMPSRQQLKPKPLVRSHQQPHKTFLNSPKNAQKSRNDAGRRAISAPRTSSSVRVPPGKITGSKCSLEIEQPVENSQIRKESSYENVPEKIIHVVESSCERHNEDHKKDSVANDSPRRKMKIKKGKSLEIENGEAGSKAKSLRRVASDGEINGKKTVSARGALRHLVIEQEKPKSDLTNAVIEGKLAKTNQGKVKALVDAFQTLINIQDTGSSSANVNI